MLIISPNKEPSASEKFAINRLQKLNGIVITGVYLQSSQGINQRDRETDLIVITPHRLAIVEVKGVRQGFSGNITVSLNDEWTVGAKQNAFYHSLGCKNPYVQAREQAQKFIESTHHLPHAVSPHFIVAIASTEKSKVYLDKPIVSVGDGTVCLVGNLSTAILSIAPGIVDLKFVKLLLKNVLQLDASMPSNTQLRAEGFLPHSVMRTRQGEQHVETKSQKLKMPPTSAISLNESTLYRKQIICPHCSQESTLELQYRADKKIVVNRIEVHEDEGEVS